MTREKFIRIHKARGYEIEELDKMIIIHMNDARSRYSAVWFFNADGSVDESQPPTWSVKRS